MPQDQRSTRFSWLVSTSCSASSEATETPHELHQKHILWMNEAFCPAPRGAQNSSQPVLSPRFLILRSQRPTEREDAFDARFCVMDGQELDAELPSMTQQPI